MTDRYGRTIDYMRVSVTGRCNLRCKYCMPNGVQPREHGDILSYDEILRVCAAAVSLGIVKFKVTGGEPLVRENCADFTARLKALPGVEQVTLTTNGLLLSENLDALCAAGIDGINISLDTLRGGVYRELTGGFSPETALNALKHCVGRGLRVKVNAVLLADTFGGLPEIAMLARDMPVDVKFIELMPIGGAAGMEGVSADTALERLREFLPGLRPSGERRGNGPARYYTARGLKGRIGFISALSRNFCGGCNRVRLTAEGILKPCLCYGGGENLAVPLRNGRTDLREVIRSRVELKPPSHCFSTPEGVTELTAMNRIGG